MDPRAWEQLLYLYDTHLRIADEDYGFGYADGIGQVILDLARITNQYVLPKHEQAEAYRRIMEFTSIPAYIKKYPQPVDRQPIHL